MGEARRFRLVADVSSDNPTGLRPVLEELVDGTVTATEDGWHVEGTVTATEDGWHVEGTVAGDSARDLNRMLLSALRRVERRARLRAAGTSGDTTERFFDYVPKGSRRTR